MFIEEQGVSVASDRDGRDPEAIHLVAVEAGEVIGTCRVLMRGRIAKLGRLAVEPDRRGEGVAAAVLGEAERVAREQGATSVALYAQTYAKELYVQAGYETRGPEFVEEGIEHVPMEKRL